MVAQFNVTQIDRFLKDRKIARKVTAARRVGSLVSQPLCDWRTRGQIPARDDFLELK